MKEQKKKNKDKSKASLKIDVNPPFLCALIDLKTNKTDILALLFKMQTCLLEDFARESYDQKHIEQSSDNLMTLYEVIANA